MRKSGVSRYLSSRKVPQVLAAFGVTLILVAAAPAGAAVITVDTLNDPGAPGECALRDAIVAANTGLDVHGCAGSLGDNTIMFAAGVSGTIMLTAPLPDIESDLTIEGPAADNIAISGNHKVELMSIDMQGDRNSTVWP